MNVKIESLDKKDTLTGQHFCICGRFFESDGRLQCSVSFNADSRLPDVMTLAEDMRAAINEGFASYIQKVGPKAEEENQPKMQ